MNKPKILDYNVAKDEFLMKYYPDAFVNNDEKNEANNLFDNEFIKEQYQYLKVLGQRFRYVKNKEGDNIIVSIYDGKKHIADYKIVGFDQEHGAVCEFVSFAESDKKKLFIINKLNELKTMRDDVGKIDSYGGQIVSLDDFLRKFDETLNVLYDYFK